MAEAGRSWWAPSATSPFLPAPLNGEPAGFDAAISNCSPHTSSASLRPSSSGGSPPRRGSCCCRRHRRCRLRHVHHHAEAGRKNQFAGPYYSSGHSMVNRSNTDIKKVADLAGKTVCQAAGSNSYKRITDPPPDGKLDLDAQLVGAWANSEPARRQAERQQPIRRRHHRRPHPRRFRPPRQPRPVGSSRSSSSLHRREVRHRPEARGHGVPQLDQRRAGGVLHRRPVEGCLGLDGRHGAAVPEGSHGLTGTDRSPGPGGSERRAARTGRDPIGRGASSQWVPEPRLTTTLGEEVSRGGGLREPAGVLRRIPHDPLPECRCLGLLSLVIGTILAAFRVSPLTSLRRVGSVIVEVARNTPLTLVFVFFVFILPGYGDRPLRWARSRRSWR